MRYLSEFNEQFVTRLKRRLGEAVDDRHEQIRLVVEDINGVGPATSKVTAREYDSLDELRGSSRERLENVPEIGALKHILLTMVLMIGATSYYLFIMS